MEYSYRRANPREPLKYIHPAKFYGKNYVLDFISFALRIFGSIQHDSTQQLDFQRMFG